MFSWIAKAFDWATGKIDSTVASWVNTVIRGIWSFLTSLFSVVIDAWNTFYGAVKDVAHGIATLALETYNWTKWLLDVFWHDWLVWLGAHVLKPLEDAYNWVVHEGATVWHYLTHAADLVDFLWDALLAQLESQAWAAADKLGQFFLALIIKNLKHFASLIEDIIDAVF